MFLGVVVVVDAYGSGKLGIGCSASFMAMVKGPVSVMILLEYVKQQPLGLYFSIATHNTMCTMKKFTLNAVQQSELLGFSRISLEEDQKK